MTDDIDTDARTFGLFLEVFDCLPRGGPGDPESTRRALALIPNLPPDPQVLDIGCGPGCGSLELARLTGGRVAAFDLQQPFVARLARAARTSGVADRVAAVCADMRVAPFAAGTFDLIWSEGALYSIGFREGLRVCYDLAKPGGYMAASEAVWTVSDPPDDARRWWDAEYGDIKSIDEKLANVVAAGFEVVGHFTLPSVAWWENYYMPMRERLVQLKDAWARDECGLAVIAQLEIEIGMYERFGYAYSYEMFVGRRP